MWGCVGFGPASNILARDRNILQKWLDEINVYLVIDKRLEKNGVRHTQYTELVETTQQPRVAQHPNVFGE